MKVNGKYILRTVAGEALLVNEGSSRVDFNNMLSLNEPAAWLWAKASESADGFDEEQLVRWLMEEFDVEEETARKDVGEMVGLWRKYGLVED